MVENGAGILYFYLIKTQWWMLAGFKKLWKLLKASEAGAIQSSILLHNPDKTAPKLINSWGNELHFLGFGLLVD